MKCSNCNLKEALPFGSGLCSGCWTEEFSSKNRKRRSTGYKKWKK